MSSRSKIEKNSPTKGAAVTNWSMIKLYCGILALVLMVCGVVNAAEPVGIEVRARNAIGRLGRVNVEVAVKAEADGSAVVTFQAPGPGTYVLVYTTGPDRGKTAATVRVETRGPVTAKVRPSRP